VLEEFHGPNAAYALELLEREGRLPTGVELGVDAARALPGVEVASSAAAAELAQHIRLYGHRAAQLDPLGGEPPGDPLLHLERHGLTEVDLARLPASVVGGPLGGAGARNAAEAIARLRRIYCSTTGYELGHVQVPAERAWLIEAVEDQRFQPPADPIDEPRLLHRLTEVSALERFLHRAYPGQTRFSIEGLGMMIPMLDEMIACAGEAGTRMILLGMAHRGRLNVLAHILGKPYERILGEFEGVLPARRARPDEGWAGDVKYHAGGRRAYRAGNQPGSVTVVLAPNPSHLEFVNPVVEGMARAADEERRGPGRPRQDEIASLAVLIHGDAAFPGQGVVAETLNLSRLPGYRTGGTLHLIANNQLGFTTGPSEARSTLYASDLAKGFEIPIVHVNAHDPVACVAATRLAGAYRNRFRKDVLIDLIGYRRWGHNEGDDPTLTQPRTYQVVAELPTVREKFAHELVGNGVVAEGEPERLLQAALDELQKTREAVLDAKQKGAGAAPGTPPPTPNGHAAPLPAVGTGVSLRQLKALNEALLRLPEGFDVNPRLERVLERRRAAFESRDGPADGRNGPADGRNGPADGRNGPADGRSGTVDWGHAEALACATILRDGVPIRLTGQDSARGTFNHRHATLHDANSGATHTPLERLPEARATFDVRNSPLSETATLGFEYGYQVHAPEALVLWEAQYGDFVNGTQVIVDEFVVSGQAKWGLVSGLVLLLPHGYEGQGPEHSSARIERFLELAAEGNVRVANCTSAAQYFHLLRRQAASLGPQARPLIVTTPKSLLRHPLAESKVADLTSGGFRPVIDDARAAEKPEKVRRVVLCSGKVWADVAGSPAWAEHADVALVRVEELYPFPVEELRPVLAQYRRARDVTWLQEEPRNMGAWRNVRGHLLGLVGEPHLRYVGRPEMASPAEGWTNAHRAEQQRIVSAVLEVASHAR
jgi:2-oxoglutarate dehydrogenase E1 component